MVNPNAHIHVPFLTQMTVFVGNLCRLPKYVRSLLETLYLKLSKLDKGHLPSSYRAETLCPPWLPSLGIYNMDTAFVFVRAPLMIQCLLFQIGVLCSLRSPYCCRSDRSWFSSSPCTSDSYLEMWLDSR